MTVHFDRGNHVDVSLARIGNNLADLLLREPRFRIKQRIAAHLDVALGVEEVLIVLPLREKIDLLLHLIEGQHWTFAAGVHEDPTVGELRPVMHRRIRQAGIAIRVTLHHLQQRLHAVVHPCGRVSANRDALVANIQPIRLTRLWSRRLVRHGQRIDRTGSLQLHCNALACLARRKRNVKPLIERLQREPLLHRGVCDRRRAKLTNIHPSVGVLDLPRLGQQPWMPHLRHDRREKATPGEKRKGQNTCREWSHRCSLICFLVIFF